MEKHRMQRGGLQTTSRSTPGRSPVRKYEVLQYYCGGNFYQAKYQGSTLKYVTTKPE
jgi:hypothetical protein